MHYALDHMLERNAVLGGFAGNDGLLLTRRSPGVACAFLRNLMLHRSRIIRLLLYYCLINVSALSVRLCRWQKAMPYSFSFSE